MEGLILIILGVASCTLKDQPLPDFESYQKDGQLMINICQKFSTEKDIQKLHKAAVATQNARVISCTDFNDECSLYGRCLALVIKAASDGKISAEESSSIHRNLIELKNAHYEGVRKLRKQLNVK